MKADDSPIGINVPYAFALYNVRFSADHPDEIFCEHIIVPCPMSVLDQTQLADERV